ncbi:hypothetical protein I6A60_31280 [Frankia sp. AgB1.9]|uniref:hypothetical protein n=1 Tax=unclassified Frankia TaxID=2632575 RepID=UPI001932CE03|nr:MULTISPECIES: hypothetical protein [unclassified Frankia]MBL7493888.1 hypothetical protein [Frankia sp. AgW1.1]MBL7552313.1 hypothetical protein [Frankia sp. AgB1.9]MBL7622066.1 hypothetical protein [Frankia sp. AgB1.8]
MPKFTPDGLRVLDGEFSEDRHVEHERAVIAASKHHTDPEPSLQAAERRLRALGWTSLIKLPEDAPAA